MDGRHPSAIAVGSLVTKIISFSIELLELIQVYIVYGLRTSSEHVRDYPLGARLLGGVYPEHARTKCWLVVACEHRDGFCPVHVAQERNIRNEKVSNRKARKGQWC